MTHRLAHADELVTLDPVFGEGETTAIMRDMWHERHGYYAMAVAVVHVDDAASVLDALTEHAVQPGDMPYDQAEPTDVAHWLEQINRWEDERTDILGRQYAGEDMDKELSWSDEWGLDLLRELADAVRKGKRSDD